MKYIIAILALVLTACSVHEAKVANQPPVIPAERKVRMTWLDGTFKSDTITMFYWPKWSEQEAQTKAEQVKKLSLDADTLETQMPAIDAVLTNASVELGQLECQALMANPSDVLEGVLPAVWNDGIPETEAEKLAKCRELEKSRWPALAKLGEIMPRYAGASTAIKAIVDPKAPGDEPGEFWKVLPANSVVLTFSETEKGAAPKVEVRMRGLLNERTRVETVIPQEKWEANRPKTGTLTDEEAAAEKKKLVYLRVTDLKYDLRMHSLSFKVSGNPEWGINETHEFTLVRYDDLDFGKPGSVKMEEFAKKTLVQIRARFGGDVVLKRDGKVVSKGSIMIRGVYKPPTTTR